jgi:hypothetical protein
MSGIKTEGYFHGSANGLWIGNVFICSLYEYRLMIPQGTIVMQGFVNSKENDVTKIMEVRELESVESVLKMEERSESSQAALQY